MAIETTSDLSLVGTSQIVDGSVTSAKIAAGAIGTSLIASGVAANGAVLTANGSGAASFLAAATGGILKYEEFTSSGSFVIPSNASSSAIAVVEIVNAGCGGESGGVISSPSDKEGGNGGAGGSYGIWTYLASAFGTAGGTVTVTIAAGGAGGTATTSATRVAGSFPGSTSFGSLSLGHLSGSTQRSGAPAWLGIANSVSGVAITGGSGTATSSPNTVTNWGEPLLHAGNAGRGFSNAVYSGFDNDFGGGGGGGGGYIGTDVAIAGARGGKRYGIYGQQINLATLGTPRLTFGNGPAGGTAGGGAGGTPTAGSGDGGGGGGAATTGNGGAGAAGAQPGGGGGGGGAARTGGTAGAGGNGGSGRVRVWVIG